MAQGEGSLKSKRLEGDRSENEKQASTALNRTKSHVMGVGTEMRAAALEHKLEIIVRTADPEQKGNPREAFRELKTAQAETLDRMDNKCNSAVMKRDGNSDESPLVAAELL